MTNRRQFMVAGALLACGRGVMAQSRVVKVGMLSARPLSESFYAAGVVRRLAELGYREGSGMTLEFRSAPSLDHYAKFAREISELKCDLVFAVGPEYAARALRDASPRTPLVFVAVDYDPLEKGIIPNLARPGGNVTGIYIPQAALAAKRLQIITEIVPGISRVLTLVDRFSSSQLPAVEKMAEAMGIQLKTIHFSNTPYDLEGALNESVKAKVEAYIELASPVLASNTKALAALLLKYRVPSVGAEVRNVQAGLLVSSGNDAQKFAGGGSEIGA